MTDQAMPDPTRIGDYWIAPSGLTLKFKKVSRFVLVEMGRKILIPKVPTFFNKEDNKEEENPNDPDYIQAVKDAEYERGMLTVAASLALGTEIIKLPDDMEGPEGNEWVDTLKELGITFNTENRLMRYQSWLKYIALDDEAFQVVLNQVLKFSKLVTEQDVAIVQESFRGETQGREHLPSPTT